MAKTELLLFPNVQDSFCKEENNRLNEKIGVVVSDGSCDETAESSKSGDDETGRIAAIASSNKPWLPDVQELLCKKEEKDRHERITVANSKSSCDKAAAAELINGSDDETGRMPVTASRSKKRTYPILAPLIPSTEGTGNCISDTPEGDNGDDHEYEFELFSLQVEMAKSAFLKDPCQTRWMDLVHSCRVQKMRQMSGEKYNIMEKRIEDHEQHQCSEEAAVNNVEIGPALAHLEESIASLGEKAILREFRHGHNNQRNDDSGLYFGDDCADNWEKAVLRAFQNDNIFGDDHYANNDEGEERSEEWSEERDVSPLPVSSLVLEEEHDGTAVPSPSGGEYDPGCIDAEEQRKRKGAAPPLAHSDNINGVDAKEGTPISSCTSIDLTTEHEARTVVTTTAKSKFKLHKQPLLEPKKTTRNGNNNSVRNEVLHWEKRIVRYDQRYVNIVAAALDECAQEKWKIGRIVEAVVPASSFPRGSGGWVDDDDDSTPLSSSSMEDDVGDEEILYLV